MIRSRGLATITVVIIVGLWSWPGLAQDAGTNGQAAPAISATGSPGNIAVWTAYHSWQFDNRPIAPER